MWVQPVKFRIHCQADMTNWPFDTQTGVLKIGSWVHSTNVINLTDTAHEVFGAIIIFWIETRAAAWRLLHKNKTKILVYFFFCFFRSKSLVLTRNGKYYKFLVRKWQKSIPAARTNHTIMSNTTSPSIGKLIIIIRLFSYQRYVSIFFSHDWFQFRCDNNSLVLLLNGLLTI